MNLSNEELDQILMNIRTDISSGLIYTHIRLNATTTKTLESTSFLYALIELLNDKGLISIEELDERKKQIAKKLVEKFVESGMGLMYQDPEYDKYTFEHEADVDCVSRLSVCRAICCKFPFALSKQDVDEGIVRWEFGRLYLIAHGDDGYCIHLDRENYKCKVRENRPVPCRGFDCRKNEKWKVWQDYEGNILNLKIVEDMNENKGLYPLKNKIKI